MVSKLSSVALAGTLTLGLHSAEKSKSPKTHHIVHTTKNQVLELLDLQPDETYDHF